MVWNLFGGPDKSKGFGAPESSNIMKTMFLEIPKVQTLRKQNFWRPRSCKYLRKRGNGDAEDPNVVKPPEIQERVTLQK